MNTRSSDKNKILYSLFDWGDNERLLPTRLVTDSDTDKFTSKKQFDSQTVKSFLKVSVFVSS